MAVTRAAAASKTNISVPKTTKNKNSKRQTNVKSPAFTKKLAKQNNSTSIRSRTCSSLKIKRTKSPGVRLIGGRIYDSENGKTCHQCRQKTIDFSVSCKNFTDQKKECSFHYCHICLLNRYGEKAEEAAELGCQWKCPNCRGVCNCSRCMKKQGSGPTGALLYAAKAGGFSSVSEMLQCENINKPEKDEGASSKKRKASNEEPAASIKRGRENGLVEEKNLTFQPEDSTNIGVESDADEDELEEVQLNGENTLEIRSGVSSVEIPLPQGSKLTKVANLDLPVKDVGYALQFLEFCEAFGEVFDLKKRQPRLLLQKLTSTTDLHRRRDFSVERLHIKLLSVIQEDSEKGYSSLKARGRNSWLEGLKNYVAKCPYFPEELISNCSDLDPDGYKKLNTSIKLRILTFLCDEALGTTELRNWIDEKNLEFVEERKKAKKIFLHQKKNERKKLRDEVARAILSRNGAPLSITEHENLVSAIKVEAAQSLAEKQEAANPEMMLKQSDAVRSDPILLDANGRKFWKLRSYTAEMDVLLQDVAYGDLITAEEKWFVYDLHEKANVERYISSFKESRQSAEVVHYAK